MLDQFGNPDNPGPTSSGPGRSCGSRPVAASRTSSPRWARPARSPASRATSSRATRGADRRRAAVRGLEDPGIRAWPPAYVPRIFDPSAVDRTVEVTQADAEEMARRLAREEGIFGGPSAAGACWTALQVAQEVEDATIVFVVCDRGDRYLSSGVFPAEANCPDRMTAQCVTCEAAPRDPLPAVLLELALTVYCLIDAVQTDELVIRNLPKLAWIFIILLFPIVGGVAWLVQVARPATRGRVAPSSSAGRTTAASRSGSARRSAVARRARTTTPTSSRVSRPVRDRGRAPYDPSMTSSVEGQERQDLDAADTRIYGVVWLGLLAAAAGVVVGVVTALSETGSFVVGAAVTTTSVTLGAPRVPGQQGARPAVGERDVDPDDRPTAHISLELGAERVDVRQGSVRHCPVGGELMTHGRRLSTMLAALVLALGGALLPSPRPAPLSCWTAPRRRGTFTSLPLRVLDTRTGTGAPKARLAPHGTVTLRVTAPAASPPPASQPSCSTSPSPTPPPAVTSPPTPRAPPHPPPPTSTSPRQTIANLAVVKVGRRRITLHNNAPGTTHLIADVAGYYLSGAATAGDLHLPATLPGARHPHRHRRPKARLAPHGTVTLRVTGTAASHHRRRSRRAQPHRHRPTTGGHITAPPAGTTPHRLQPQLHPPPDHRQPRRGQGRHGGRITLHNNAPAPPTSSPTSPATTSRRRDGRRDLHLPATLPGARHPHRHRRPESQARPTRHRDPARDGTGGVPPPASQPSCSTSVTDPTTGGHITAHPAGTTPHRLQPQLHPPVTIANLACVKVGTGGDHHPAQQRTRHHPPHRRRRRLLPGGHDPAGPVTQATVSSRSTTSVTLSWRTRWTATSPAWWSVVPEAPTHRPHRPTASSSALLTGRHVLSDTGLSAGMPTPMPCSRGTRSTTTRRQPS